MHGLKYFKKSDFEKTNYIYSELNPLRLKFLKLGGKRFGRLRYNLPNGKIVDYSKIPEECENHIRIRSKIEKELGKLLSNGYFPLKDIDKLSEVKALRKGNNPSIDEAIELYPPIFGKLVPQLLI